jgi:hypothetical protein
MAGTAVSQPVPALSTVMEVITGQCRVTGTRGRQPVTTARLRSVGHGEPQLGSDCRDCRW